MSKELHGLQSPKLSKKLGVEFMPCCTTSALKCTGFKRLPTECQLSIDPAEVTDDLFMRNASACQATMLQDAVLVQFHHPGDTNAKVHTPSTSLSTVRRLVAGLILVKTSTGHCVEAV